MPPRLVGSVVHNYSYLYECAFGTNVHFAVHQHQFIGPATAFIHQQPWCEPLESAWGAMNASDPSKSMMHNHNGVMEIEVSHTRGQLFYSTSLQCCLSLKRSLEYRQCRKKSRHGSQQPDSTVAIIQRYQSINHRDKYRCVPVLSSLPLFPIYHPTACLLCVSITVLAPGTKLQSRCALVCWMLGKYY